MDKSIIAIDTPINCTVCPLSNYHGYTKSYYCGGTGEYSREIEDYKWYREKPEWCPLLPLPEEKYNFGSECLDKIIKKEEQK